ncbi:hypothetical protein VB773_10400 [Haloarculaceae archaeon H-GB2-1]|nr:hypothetical protein [Haloarculaceae archaeon H-GB1-1]MEA5407928.1 hypothetical protein [Haloarculaceae archaeon H-GB2-1]
MDDTETSVDVIAPNLPVEGAIVRANAPDWVDQDDVRVIGYPKFVFEYDITLEQAFLSDRTVIQSVTVDAVTGGRLRNDTYPDVESRTIPKEALVQPRFQREGAIEKAKSAIRRYISFHYPTSVLVRSLPDMEISREDFAFTLYWLVPMGSGPDSETVTIVDAVTGEAIEEDVRLENVTAETVAN